jgi:hypothetical protein
MNADAPLSPSEELIDKVERGRFELRRNGELCGWLYYTHLKPNRYALQHTEVEASHRGEGVGAAMVRRVLDEIRARGGTITVICPFVAEYVSKTTDYADLVDPRHPGYADRTEAEAAAARSSD